MVPLAFSMVGLFLLSIVHVPAAIWRWGGGFATSFLFPYATTILRTLVRLAPGKPAAAGGTKVTSYALFTLLTAVCQLHLKTGEQVRREICGDVGLLRSGEAPPASATQLGRQVAREIR
jgi:hypothetical protein